MTLPDFLTQDSDGEIRLAGHRIGLYTLVRLHQEGYPAERIAAELPSLSLDLVRTVLDFYGANRAEVDCYAGQYRLDLERQAAQPPGPGIIRMRRLLEKLQRADECHRDDPEWRSLPLREKVRRIEQEDLPKTV